MVAVKSLIRASKAFPGNRRFEKQKKPGRSCPSEGHIRCFLQQFPHLPLNQSCDAVIYLFISLPAGAAVV